MLTCRTRFLITCATSALLVGVALTSPALAADPPVPNISIESPWYTEGFLEVGGRFFLNNPQRGAQPGTGSSLASYYEYSTLKPGPFGNVWLAAGTRDGVYGTAIWGRNIGYSDQAFGLEFNKAGEHYVSLGWDQTPHVYSTSAQTIYGGVGTNFLFLAPGLANALRLLSGNTSPITPAAALAVDRLLNAAEHPTDIGVRRDTASFDYRATPNSAWDVRANFSNTHREGTLVDGVSFSAGTSGVVSQVPKPVNDDTKNYGLSAEYQGDAPWGRQFTLKLGYNGSTYTDNYKNYFVQNPFCLTADTVCARASAPLAMVSLPPSNSSNGVSGTLALDLPFKMRFVNTTSWTNMQQNDPFLPFTINPVLANPAGPTPNLQLPASSLNGQINTILINNVLTKEITPDLKAKASYRYYDFNNSTPELLFPNWIVTDVATAGATTAQYSPVRSLSMSYRKQNGGAELTWRAVRSLNLGMSYGYERYDWRRESATSTDEHTFKTWADFKPATWIDARASAQWGRRTNSNYNYLLNQGFQQWLTIVPGFNPANPGSVFNNPDYRAFYLAGRERVKVDAQVGVTVLPGLRVTPSVSHWVDDYPMPNAAAAITTAAINNPNWYQEGLRAQRSTKSGVDLSYAFNSATRLYAFYMHEWTMRSYQGGSPGTNALTSTNQVYFMNAPERVHTAKIGIDSAVTDRLDLKAGFTYSRGRSAQALPFATGIGTFPAYFVNYPDVITTLSRVEGGAKYTFGDDWVHSIGLSGKMSLNLNYAWERNNVVNWQQATTNYMYYGNNVNLGYMTWLGYYNPNYSVHRLAASLAYKW